MSAGSISRCVCWEGIMKAPSLRHLAFFTSGLWHHRLSGFSGSPAGARAAAVRARLVSCEHRGEAASFTKHPPSCKVTTKCVHLTAALGLNDRVCIFLLLFFFFFPACTLGFFLSLSLSLPLSPIVWLAGREWERFIVSSNLQCFWFQSHAMDGVLSWRGDLQCFGAWCHRNGVSVPRGFDRLLYCRYTPLLIVPRVLMRVRTCHRFVDKFRRLCVPHRMVYKCGITDVQHVFVISSGSCDIVIKGTVVVVRRTSILMVLCCGLTMPKEKLQFKYWIFLPFHSLENSSLLVYKG